MNNGEIVRYKQSSSTFDDHADKSEQKLLMFVCVICTRAETLSYVSGCWAKAIANISAAHIYFSLSVAPLKFYRCIRIFAICLI